MIRATLHDIRSALRAGWLALIDDWRHSRACREQAEAYYANHPDA